MQLEFAFLCDAAVESGGKVHVLGLGITDVAAPRLPAVHPRLALVARFSFTRADEGKKRFAVRVRNADGGLVGNEVQGEMQLRLADDVSVARANMLIDLNNLEFTSYGPYEAVVSIDGEELVNAPIEVIRPR